MSLRVVPVCLGGWSACCGHVTARSDVLLPILPLVPVLPADLFPCRSSLSAMESNVAQSQAVERRMPHLQVSQAETRHRQPSSAIRWLTQLLRRKPRVAPELSQARG